MIPPLKTVRAMTVGHSMRQLFLSMMTSRSEFVNALYGNVSVFNSRMLEGNRYTRQERSAGADQAG